MSDQHKEEESTYGGQAVIEGVMMRGPRHYAVACRRANKDIVVLREPMSSALVRLKWLNKPFLRGTLALIDAMVLGIKSLTFAANIAMEDIQAEETAKKAENPPDPRKAKAKKASSSDSSSVSNLSVSLMMILGLVLGFGLFFFVPSWLASKTSHVIKSYFWSNLLEGLIRIAVFILYVGGISMMKDIRRVFEYHGAEHKIINTYEDHQELTQEEAAKRTTVHVRCGTSFILVVLVVSIVVFAFLPWNHGWQRHLSRLVLLPVVAGISYEVIRFAGRHRESVLLRAALAPGLWMQKITTRRPSPDQVEVAKVALESVLDAEARHRAGEKVEPSQSTISAGNGPDAT